MPEQEDEREWSRDIPGYGEVRFRAYKERYSGSRDEVVIHVYVGDPPDTDHSVYRFYITDEREQLCKYHTTRNEPEPQDIALFALQEYGWDCTNFDLPSEKENINETSEMLHELGEHILRISVSSDDATREMLEEAFVRLEIAANLHHAPKEERSMADLIQAGEFDPDEGAADMALEVPGGVGQENQARLSTAMMVRLQKLLEDHTDHEEYAVDDQRYLK